jgi:hypothetical protein
MNMGFVKRDGPLMYAIFCEDRVYLIDILGHDDFANEHLFRVVATNWPNDGLVFKLGILPGSSPTTEERKITRSVGVDMVVNVDGHAYMSAMTVGLTGAGTSTRHSYEAQRFLRVVQQAEKDCQSDGFAQKLYGNLGVECPADPELHFASLRDGWGVIDRNGSLLHRLGT